MVGNGMKGYFHSITNFFGLLFEKKKKKFGHAIQHAGSQFPDQGLNPPLSCLLIYAAHECAVY